MTFGQSGSNVQYVQVDSISPKYFDRDVKIDFKSRRLSENIYSGRRCDTVSLKLNGKMCDLIEVKDTSPDFHRFGKEHLESHNYKPGTVVSIYKMRMLEMSSDSILFQLTLQAQESKRNKPIRMIDLEIIKVLVPKNMIEGIMIKKFEMSEDK